MIALHFSRYLSPSWSPMSVVDDFGDKILLTNEAPLSAAWDFMDADREPLERMLAE